MDTQKISYLQQAIWKVQAAQTLIKLAFNGTDVWQMYESQFEELILDIESDIAELYDPAE